MLHMSKYPSSRSGGPEKVREEFSSRTRTEGNRMADEKKSKMWRRSFLQKTGVGAAAVGAMTAAPTILKMTENVQASPPPGDMNAPVMAYVKDAATGTVVVMWGTQEIVTRDPGLVIRLTNYARRGPMSSHREAPTISKDPVADNTDLYAFVDPVDTSKVTILSNFIPLEEPAGGPNFFQFGDDVLYEILIDNDGDGVEDVTYQFRFKTTTQNPATFLYNTGPIGSLTDPNWNVRQLYSVAKVVGPRRTGSSTVLGSDLPTPPVRIGPRSTPDYATLAAAPVNVLSVGVQTAR